MKRRNVILLLAVMLAALFSGCVTEMSADQIVQKMKEKQDSVRDFSATMSFTMSFAGENIASKAKIMNKMPDKIKIEYLLPSEIAGQILVSDGANVWMYDPKTKIVTKEAMQIKSVDFQQNYMKFIREIIDRTNITYQGTDELEGRTVYRIKAVSRNESITGMHSSMWVDSETFMPLKIELTDNNGKPITTFEYNDVKLNTGIPDSEFVFKVPADARVVE